ncbi:MAG: VacJ family lipoprotein [Rubritepida sp.]|jgi:phospholipid-binding lipoprotein MlaA|nr:VacJ family lipoprotein [Rubritepida sp.]MCU0945344.1 VacJ family lipoprotein [Rubritepida sp.]
MPLPRLLAAFLALALLGACAAQPPADDPEALEEFVANNDPLEPLNRSVYDANDVFDRAVLRPVAVAYRQVVPQPVRTGVRNVLGNLRAPVILANDLMQGEVQRAGRTASRFAINSTLGLGGIFDVAQTQFGIRGHSEDFGQTLAVWGVPEGHYLYVPVFGPTNSRDLVGVGVDIAMSPWFWFGQGAVVEALGYTRTGMTVVDGREGVIDVLDDVNRTSLDPYSTIRSAYRQRRAAEISNTGFEAPEAATGLGFGVGTGVPVPRQPGAAPAPAPANGGARR